MIIRQEKPEDYNAVYQFIKEAFEKAEHTDIREMRKIPPENTMLVCVACGNGGLFLQWR